MAREAMDTVVCRLLKTPQRSLDLNAIENDFNNIRIKISKETIEKNVKQKHLDSFVIV